MACEIKAFAKIRDFTKVQEYFGLSHDDDWFNAIHYAISPTSELIALAQGEKLALLSSSWDNKCQATTYILSWCGELEDPNEIITALLCLPVYGKSVSSGPEWTCIALGLSSGMMVFYTDAGLKIFSQSYYDSPVISIKAYTPPRHSESDSFVYVIYDQYVCTIKGSDIFTLISNLRHNLNRTLGRNALLSDSNAMETVDTLQFQRFKFARDRETVINDAVVTSTHTPSMYDNIVQQSIGCGYYAKISETPTQSALVVGVGAEPYLGFYCAEEGYKTISLGEVAKDVIGTAYKNLLGNIFGRGGPAKPEDQVAVNKDAQMRARSHFSDGKRDGYTIALTPCGHYAAVTDNLDRVTLVDTRRAIVLRVWKGYREAQCAFVPVKEKTLKGVNTHRRKALFLVIYAPRMGCIEIWALQNGPKVAAFAVSKSGQLAYNTHGLLGVHPDSKVKAPINFCLFLDPHDANVKEIQIPFHYALSETNSKTSKDIHLLRRIKSYLRDANNTHNIDKIAQLSTEFQTLEVRQQCLEMLKRNKQLKPQILKTIVNAFAESFSLDDSGDTLSEEQIIFSNLVSNYKRLTDFYIEMQTPKEAEFNEHLELSDCDLVIINQLVLLLKEKTSKCSLLNSEVLPTSSKVTFQEQCKDDGYFVDYLSIFQLDQVDRIPLHKSKSTNYGYVSGKLFGDFFERGLCFKQFKNAAEAAKIPYEDLLVLVLHFWIEKAFEYQSCDEVISDMSCLAAMIRAICELAGSRVNSYVYNAISPWWQNVRELLLESPKSLGLLVAIVCKTVATDSRRSVKESSCDETEEDEHFESISHDGAQWDLLIGKLEDIAILGAILENPITSVDPVMPEAPYTQPHCSLKLIVDGGKGIVSYLTAQWLIKSRVSPSQIVEPQADKGEKLKTENETQTNAQVVVDDEMKQLPTIKDDHVLQKLSLLRRHFPFSLQSGILLSHMAWEYMVHWSKNFHNLELMRAALKCLAEFKEEDYALRHGMHCMIWNTTLKHPFQATTKLVQKVGHLPKDKMCKQDIEMTASLVPEFLKLCLNFIESLDECIDVQQEKPDFKFEELLQDGQPPIQLLALQQKRAQNGLVHLNMEVCNVLYLIAFLQMKVHKPITTLFDAISNKALQEDINKELEYDLTQPDLILTGMREQFLCKAIAASMSHFTVTMVAVVHVKILCTLWGLGYKLFLQRYVVEWYARGFDELAENLLTDLVNDQNIGWRLLEIAGKRMNLLAKSSNEAYLKIALIGPDLLNYLDNLNTACAPQITATEPHEINLDALTRLVTLILKHISRDDRNGMQMATYMFDACNYLLDRPQQL